ncbi:MAG TPA: DUF429 domain-containing protein [Terriglobia bacterium]|nr:DUF429 domain-containing protein [Terriglobia bacterium]
MPKDSIVIGVDGCSGGWLCFKLNLQSRQTEVKVHCSFADVISEIQSAKLSAVDIPIGLPDSSSRDCDLNARRQLGKPRSTSVFPPPVRSALNAMNYQQACALNRKACGKALTKQTYAICKKILEVDMLMSQKEQSRIYEVHPEVCSWALNGFVSMRYSKRKAEGHRDRQKLLSFQYPEIKQHVSQLVRREARADDLLDAAAAAWTAERIAKGKATHIPTNPQLNRKRLRM